MKKLLLLIVILLSACSKEVVYDECFGTRRLINLDEFTDQEFTFHNASFTEVGDEYLFTYGTEPEMTKRYARNTVFFYCFNDDSEVYGGELNFLTKSVDVRSINDFDVEYDVINSVKLNTELEIYQTFTVNGERSLYVSKDLISYGVQEAYDSFYSLDNASMSLINEYSLKEFNGEHTFSLSINFDDGEYEVGLYTISVEFTFYEEGIKYTDRQHFLIEVYE